MADRSASRLALLALAAAIAAGCTATRPAPVVDRAPPKPTTAPPPVVAKPAPAPSPADTVVTAPLRAPSGAVEARPLTGAAAPPAAPPPSPTVMPGEKLVTEPKGVRLPYSDQALAQLARPEVTAPPRIEPPRPDSDTARGPDDLDWAWPTSGKVVATFNDATNKGISIAGKPGQPVLASAPGRVIFSGTGIRGFGKLIVIKHNNTYLSVYGHNNQLLVKEGQNVTKGQRIAEMGNTDADQVKLHFEIRRFGKPVDPLKFLPPA